MKFKKYLKLDKKVKQMRDKLAKERKVDPESLDYIGVENYGVETMYYFNIMDKKHKHYKSTIAIVEKI